MNSAKTVIETARLFISEFSETDTDFILRLLNSPGWIQFIGDRGIKTEEDARNYLLNAPIASYAKNGFGLWRIDEKSSGLPVGMCGLIKRDTLDDIDIGFALLPEFSGKGYALESASACMDFAKDQLQLKRIVAIVLPSNQRSVRLLEKLGMKFEKPFEQGREVLHLFGRNFHINQAVLQVVT